MREVVHEKIIGNNLGSGNYLLPILQITGIFLVKIFAFARQITGSCGQADLTYALEYINLRLIIDQKIRVWPLTS